MEPVYIMLVKSRRSEFRANGPPGWNSPVLRVQLLSRQPRRLISSSVSRTDPYFSNNAKMARTRSASSPFTSSRPPPGSMSYPSTGQPPIHFPFRRAADILSRVRSPISSRSNCANEMRMFSVSRPSDVLVLNCCVTVTKHTLCFSKTLSMRVKSSSDRLSRSTLYTTTQSRACSHYSQCFDDECKAEKRQEDDVQFFKT